MGPKLHPAQLAEHAPAKKRFFDDFAALCVDAASQSLGLLIYMREAGLLSSLTTLDTGCVLEDLQVFMLAVARGDGRAHAVHVLRAPSSLGRLDASNASSTCLFTQTLLWASAVCRSRISDAAIVPDP